VLRKLLSQVLGRAAVAGTSEAAIEAAEHLIAAGNQAEGEGRLREACESYCAAVDAASQYAPAHLNLGIGLEAAGNPQGALESYERACALDPANPFVNYNLGKLLGARGNLERAERLLRAALRWKPAFAEAHVALSNLYDARGNLREAANHLEAALNERPDYVGALLNYAAVLQKMGRAAEAAACYEKALALQPGLAEAHWHVGDLIADQGRLEEAAGHYRAALALEPALIDPQHSLCMVLYEQGRPGDAIACLREVLWRNAAYTKAYLSLGTILSGERRLGEAEDALRRALVLEPALAAAHVGLGNIHSARDQTEEAIRCYETALSIDPENIDARWSRAMCALQGVYRTDAEALDSRIAFSRELEALDRWVGDGRLVPSVRGVGNPPPFYLAYHEANNRDLLDRYGRLCAGVMRSWLDAQQLDRAPPRDARAPIRIGVVSAHFQDHSVWNALVKGWFQHMDRDRFALEAFYLGTEDDPQTLFAQSLASHFERGSANPRHWVQAIAQRRPHVLIYPEIGMNFLTFKLASLRLAPVQVASWGHPETSGLPTIDYYVSAEALEPERAGEHYTERLELLPHLGCCYPSRRIAAVSADLAGQGVDPSIPILVCPGTPFKYAPRHDRVFAEIAGRLGRCRFVFFTYRVPELSGKLHDRLRTLFRAHRMAADEFISFVPWQSPAQFRGLMERAHVFLDTIGFSGFNTAMEAVECALPIVTREGRFMRGRLASGILKRMGLQELVARSEDDYIDLAVRICRDDAYRAHLRQRIEAQRGILFDDPAPIRALEEFITRIAGPR
jgi:protein O-GlcNAc transferase